jgi:hypothetical protein
MLGKTVVSDPAEVAYHSRSSGLTAKLTPLSDQEQGPLGKLLCPAES